VAKAKRKIESGEPITENRRVIRIGRSFYLNLPQEFVFANKIKPGQKVPITCNHLLKVIPHPEE
jgi:hypothetical protein